MQKSSFFVIASKNISKYLKSVAGTGGHTNRETQSGESGERGQFHLFCAFHWA
jgi:hypothetical protein